MKEQTEVNVRKKEKKNEGNVAIGCCVVVFIVLIVVIVWGVQKSSKTNEPTPTNKSQSSDEIKNIGSEAKLHIDDVPYIFVAINKSSGQEMNKFFLANDSTGLAELQLGNRIFKVDNDTKVKILDVAVWDGLYEIRILDGSNAGKSGWTSTAFVK